MKWPWFRFPKRRKPIRRSAGHVRPVLEELETRVMPAVNALTYQYGNDVGVNSQETQLTPATVSSGAFNKMFSTPVDGQVYAQPLVDTGVTITNGPYSTAGAAGVHNVVFIATENDSLYAINADPSSSGQILWYRSFLDPNNADDALPTATSVTPIPYQDATGSTDLTPVFGITSTPVIDPSTNVMYVITATAETVSGTTHFVQRLHAINIDNGSDAVTPYVIGDSTGIDTYNASAAVHNNTPIYVYGDGPGSVTDPYNGTGNPVVQFSALHENQRAALELANGTLYAAWSSHGDSPPFYGWLVSWNVSNLKSAGFQLSGVFNADPNGGGGGIWGAGAGISFDPNGSGFYFVTGNTAALPTPLNANGFPSNGNYPDAVVKLAADPTTTAQNQNTNGWGFQVVDYFIPYNEVTLDNDNLDLSSGVQLLPASAGIPGHSNLLVAGGKDGRLYLIDRNAMGEYSSTGDNIVNAVPDANGVDTPPQVFNGFLSTAIYFNGELYGVGGYSDLARAFDINSDGTLSQVSQTTENFGFEPGSPSISANGTSTGIVWLINRSTNELQAYAPNNLGNELWSSGQSGNSLGATATKFVPPTVANGMVFVATNNGLVVYSLTQPTAVSQTPSLSATTLSSTSVNLSWQDDSQRPNIASSYLIEESTDGVNFTQVTTAAPDATSLAIGGLSADTTYYFRIRGLNSVGASAYSNVVSATTTASTVAGLDFSSGFAGSSNQLTYNGSASINGAKALLTDGGTDEAGSFFSNSPVNVASFSSQFTFQLSSGASTADGFTFTIQGAGPTALGPLGGGLGYGPDSTGNSGGIPQSVAIKFDLYNNEGEGNDSTGLYTDGAAPTTAGSIDLTGTSIDLHSGDVFQVNMTYNGATLTVVIKDTNTGASATQNYTIDIPGTVGGDTAYVGFTGGTGGLTATQQILSWTFTPNGSQAPDTPTNLSAVPAAGNAITLNWNTDSSSATGFYLDRATDPGFTQNLITELVPASPNVFTDSASGITPGGTYYYRLRAFNSEGSSANTGAITVTMPLPPPAPTNPVITYVSTREIDLHWTDNAGGAAIGYEIYRSTSGGPFTLAVYLPAGSTSWNDSYVNPGTYYEYHIVAYNVVGGYGYADVGSTTRSLPPPPPHTTPKPATTTSSSPTNLYQSLFQLEIDAFLFAVYSSSGSASSAQISSLVSAILANPLFNTSLGNYALQQGFSLGQSAASHK